MMMNRGVPKDNKRRVSVLGAIVASCLVACAGSNAAPENAEPAAMPEPVQAEPTAELSEESATSEEQPNAGVEASSAEPASAEDMAAALQVVLQDDALLSELKLEEPGRFPLKISGGALSGDLKLQARTEAVEVVTNPTDTKTQAVLVFTEIQLNAKKGMFKYRYEIGGVRGTSYVEKNSAGVWELRSSRVSEY